MKDIIKLNCEILQAHQVRVGCTFCCSYTGLPTSVRTKEQFQGMHKSFEVDMWPKCGS